VIKKCVLDKTFVLVYDTPIKAKRLKTERSEFTMGLKNLFNWGKNASSACGSACGAGDGKPKAACGSACGASGNKPKAACGSACGAGGEKK
jgi:hypothetical protein